MSQPHENGYYTVPKADETELMKKSSPGLSCHAVWRAMLRLSNDKRSNSFSARISLIATLAGVRYRTALNRLKELEALGYIACTHPVSHNNKRSKVATFTILRGKQLSCRNPNGSSAQSQEPPAKAGGMNKKEYIW